MDEQLRIGDAERERAATELGEHYAQGRLTAEEHIERLDRIWAARTRAELGPVFADLPGPERPAPPPRAFRGVRRPPFPVFPVLAVLFVIAVLTHAPWLVALPIIALVVLAKRGHWSRWGR